MASSSPAGTVPGLSEGNIAFVTTNVDTATATPSNKIERPPLGYMDISGSTMTSAPPGYAYTSDPEKGASPTESGTPTSRKPLRTSSSGALMMEVDKLHGYREGVDENDDREKRAANTHVSDNFRLSLTAPPDNTHVVLDDDVKNTKVSSIILYHHSLRIHTSQHRSADFTPTSLLRQS